MHAIVAIPIIIIVLFLIAIVYFASKESITNTQSMDIISSINSRFRFIGKVIQDTQIKNVSSTENRLLQLEEISRLFKYEKESNFFWIEYRFKNNTNDDITFMLTRTTVTIDQKEIECDLSLLLEFVPEFLAPPYGIRYFNTKSFNNYTLGTRGQKNFRFESRFSIEQRNNFKSSDFIKIEIELNKFNSNNKEYIPFEKIFFIETFEKIAQTTIYSIDEQIKWED